MWANQSFEKKKGSQPPKNSGINPKKEVHINDWTSTDIYFSHQKSSQLQNKVFTIALYSSLCFEIVA